jgi:membrane-associated phospholipid phosphatase
MFRPDPQPLRIPTVQPMPFRVILAALTLVLATLPRPAAAQEHPSTDRLLWAGAGAAFVGSVLLDRTIESAIPDGGGTRWRWLSRPFNRGGRQNYALAGLAGTYVGARLAHAPRVAQAAEHVGIALLASGAANGALKFTVGRERPSFTSDPHRFRPFNSKDRWQSFPSGHAIIAFSLAASISEEAREPWVTALGYGTASLVGWSRVYDHRHWASDVVGGAIVAVATSRWTIQRLHAHRDTAAGDTTPATSPVSISPLPGGVMVSIAH